MLFRNVPRVSVALSSQLAMPNTQRPVGERDKQLKLGKAMVSWVRFPPATGYASRQTMSTGSQR